MQDRRFAGWEWALPATVTLAAALLRWMQINDEGMWLDEAFSVWIARLPLPDLFAWIVRIDQHPPLYYLLLHGWLALGESEAALRGLSALLATCAVPLIYLAARRLFGVAGAVSAALLLALSPFNVRYGQEVRMYALLVLCVAAALVALTHLLTGNRRRSWWLLYVASSAAALYTYNIAVLYFAAVNVGIAGAYLTAQRSAPATDDLPPLRSWLLAQAGVILLWLPWAPSFLRQVIAVDREFWIPAPTLNQVTETAQTLVSAYLPGGDAANWVWAGAGLALLLGIVALARRRALLWLLLSLVIVPFAGELLISLRRPIFYDRTLIWLTLPLILIAAAGVAMGLRAERRRIPALAGTLAATAGVAVLLFGNVRSLENYYANFHKEEWREAASWLQERVGPNDLLLFNATWVQLPFDYYFARSEVQVDKRGAPADLFDAGILEPKMTEGDIPRLQNLLQGYDCVWLVYSHDWYTDPDKIIPRVLRRELMSKNETNFNGLKIQLYESRTGPRCPNPQP